MPERIKKPKSAFRDTSWETVKQLVSREVDRLDYYLHLEKTKAIEDTDSLIVVEVSTAQDASVLARRYSSQLRDALALVERPRVVLRLRANIAPRHEEPDYYFRDILPTARQSTHTVRSSSTLRTSSKSG